MVDLSGETGREYFTLCFCGVSRGNSVHVAPIPIERGVMIQGAIGPHPSERACKMYSREFKRPASPSTTSGAALAARPCCNACGTSKAISTACAHDAERYRRQCCCHLSEDLLQYTSRNVVQEAIQTIVMVPSKKPCLHVQTNGKVHRHTER